MLLVVFIVYAIFNFKSALRMLGILTLALAYFAVMAR